MPITIQWPKSPALARRLAEMQAAVRPGSRVLAKVQRDIREIVIKDHTDKMLRDVDRYGQTRAPLAESTRRRRRGSGPSLVPRGSASRFITNFEAVWEDVDGRSVLTMRFVGIVNKRGQGFAQYHLTGASKPGTRWVLPRRDVSGITPKGWAQIVERQKKFAEEVVRGGGGR